MHLIHIKLPEKLLQLSFFKSQPKSSLFAMPFIKFNLGILSHVLHCNCTVFFMILFYSILTYFTHLNPIYSSGKKKFVNQHRHMYGSHSIPLFSEVLIR